jgi:hypothetical protein
MKGRASSILMACAVSVLGYADARGEAFLQESFRIGPDPAAGQYETGGLRNQGPAVDGYSPGTVWGGNSGNFLVTEGPLSSNASGYVNPGGGRIELIGVTRPDPAGQDLTRFVNRGLADTTSPVLYMGGLVNRGSGLGAQDQPAVVNPGSFALMGFTNAITTGGLLQGTAGGEGNMFGLTWGFAGNNAGDYDLVIRHRRREVVGTNDVIQPFNDVLISNAAADTTYLVLLKFELNNIADTSATFGNDTITYWVGSNDGGFNASTEALASATALAHGTLSSFGFNTASDVQRVLFAQYLYEAQNAFFDAPRIGTSWESIVVPEPGAAMMLLGLGALMIRRRRA